MNQQLDIEGGRHDLAPATETLKLFGSAPQIKGQTAMQTDPEVFPGYALKRRASLVGARGKFHLVRVYTSTAACGKDASAFNSSVPREHHAWVRDNGHVCARCMREVPR